MVFTMPIALRRSSVSRQMYKLYFILLSICTLPMYKTRELKVQKQTPVKKSYQPNNVMIISHLNSFVISVECYNIYLFLFFPRPPFEPCYHLLIFFSSALCRPKYTSKTWVNKRWELKCYNIYFVQYII